MAPSLLEFYPDGDLMLVLQRPNLQRLRWFANKSVWEREEKLSGEKDRNVKNEESKDTKSVDDRVTGPVDGEVSEKSGSQEAGSHFATRPAEGSGSNTQVTLLPSDRCEAMLYLETMKATREDGSPNEIRMRVSSHSLSLASPVFQKMLKKPWKESTIHIDGGFELKTSEWDALALVIVLNIIHGHHKALPHKIDLDTMGKVTAIIDYYDCRDITDIFTTNWIKLLVPTLPEKYGEESTIWLYLAHVYKEREVLQEMAKLTCLNARWQPYTIGFVLPKPLLNRIAERRTELIKWIFKFLDDQVIWLSVGSYCQLSCQSMVVGSLVRQMHIKSLNPSRRSSNDHCINWLLTTIGNFEVDGDIYDRSDPTKAKPHRCPLAPKLKKGLELIKNSTDSYVF